MKDYRWTNPWDNWLITLVLSHTTFLPVQCDNLAPQPPPQFKLQTSLQYKAVLMCFSLHTPFQGLFLYRPKDLDPEAKHIQLLKADQKHSRGADPQTKH